MNAKSIHVIYRGFTPMPIETNYSIEKPDVIYRGFKVNKRLQDRVVLIAAEKIYRGIRIGARASSPDYVIDGIAA